MSNHTHNPNFRYGNDNRDLTAANNPFLFPVSYPSQGMPPLGVIKGNKGYYPNDNKGYYINSNRVDISIIDQPNKKQPPNSNYKIP